MSTEEFNDEMHRLIVNRLKERNRKMEIIRKYEKPNKGRLIPIVGFLVAACMVGVIFHMSISQSIDSTNEPIRSSMENIQGLIDAGRYNDALTIVENELHSADSTLNVLKSECTDNDDETLYDIKVLEVKIKDLTKDRDALRKKIK